MLNKKNITLLIYSCFIIFCPGCSNNEPEQITIEKDISADYKSEEVVTSDIIPLNFDTIKGNWDLKYGDNYGYSFRLGKNYRAVVILYLNCNSILFKGIYTIEKDDILRINISEMKREESVNKINTTRGFTQVKSSYFLFNTRIFEKTGKTIMELRPVRILIDDNSSDGYFEPLVRLTKQG